MDAIIQTLFNTNHETPSLFVVCILIAIAIIMPVIMQNMRKK